MNIFRKRRGVAQAIATYMLMLILFAGLYIPLNYAVSQYNSLVNTNILAGYDPSTLQFVNSYWTWLPAIIFFVGIGYVYMKAQQRNYMGE
jgi:hypothetical protein